MSEIIVVTKAEYVSGHTLAITFNDGLKAEINYSLWIEKYPFFAPLKDVTYFKNFSVDEWTVSWPNGADIAPETLHKIAVQNSVVQSAQR